MKGRMRKLDTPGPSVICSSPVQFETKRTERMLATEATISARFVDPDSTPGGSQAIPRSRWRCF